MQRGQRVVLRRQLYMLQWMHAIFRALSGEYVGGPTETDVIVGSARRIMNHAKHNLYLQWLHLSTIATHKKRENHMYHLGTSQVAST